MSTTTFDLSVTVKNRARRALGLPLPEEYSRTWSDENMTFRFLPVTPAMEEWLSRHPEALSVQRNNGQPLPFWSKSPVHLVYQARLLLALGESPSRHWKSHTLAAWGS